MLPNRQDHTARAQQLLLIGFMPGQKARPRTWKPGPYDTFRKDLTQY